MKTGDLIEAMLNKMAAYDPSVSVIRPVGAKMYTARLRAKVSGNRANEERYTMCGHCQNGVAYSVSSGISYREAEGHTPDAAITHLYTKVCGRALATAEAP